MELRPFRPRFITEFRTFSASFWPEIAFVTIVILNADEKHLKQNVEKCFRHLASRLSTRRTCAGLDGLMHAVHESCESTIRISFERLPFYLTAPSNGKATFLGRIWRRIEGGGSENAFRGFCKCRPRFPRFPFPTADRLCCSCALPLSLFRYTHMLPARVRSAHRAFLLRLVFVRYALDINMHGRTDLLHWSWIWT